MSTLKDARGLIKAARKDFYGLKPDVYESIQAMWLEQAAGKYRAPHELVVQVEVITGYSKFRIKQLFNKFKVEWLASLPDPPEVPEEDKRVVFVPSQGVACILSCEEEAVKLQLLLPGSNYYELGKLPVLQTAGGYVDQLFSINIA